jgi:hypothetical protein
MSTFNVDLSRMRAKMRALEFASEHAKNRGVEAVGGLLVDVLDDLSPKDTNRYVRAWIEAGRKAGVTDRPLPALRESRDREKYLEKLRSQLEFWIGRRNYARSRMEQYERYDATAPPRKDGKPRRKRTSQPYYAKMKKLENRAGKQVERAARELTRAEGSEHFIFFDAESIVQRKQNRSLSTVRHKHYGGEGRVIRSGTTAIVELRNKEPHALPVERHPHLGHPAATAKQIVQLAGAKPAGKAYKAALARHAPGAMSRAA